jgi:hypothetical protein
VQILWNLTGGIMVLRGGYHAPTSAEQREMEMDAPGDAAPNGTPPGNEPTLTPRVTAPSEAV